MSNEYAACLLDQYNHARRVFQDKQWESMVSVLLNSGRVKNRIKASRHLRSALRTIRRRTDHG